MKIESAIREKLQKRFTPVHMDLANESRRHHRPEGAETHFKLLLVSEVFEGVSRLKRQQLVNETLNTELIDPVHAFTMKCLTPDEWRALPEDQRGFRAIGH